jgi:hypothetical protein
MAAVLNLEQSAVAQPASSLNEMNPSPSPSKFANPTTFLLPLSKSGKSALAGTLDGLSTISSKPASPLPILSPLSKIGKSAHEPTLVEFSTSFTRSVSLLPP